MGFLRNSKRHPVSRLKWSRSLTAAKTVIAVRKADRQEDGHQRW